MKSKSAGKNLYFCGIGGTGMASVAGLAKQAGFNVCGSDSGLYPPMSELLQQEKIEVKTPYNPKNINNIDTDLFIIANALSRGHQELESIIDSRIPYTSFPDFLGRVLLKDRVRIVVSGTHGKTTTSSALSHALKTCGYDPGYMIGGIPNSSPTSFNLGSDLPFVIEGDEYDTAFFDKSSKFLHYKPDFLILNNLEFDHADIFKDIHDIHIQFLSLIELVPNKRNILANMSDPGVRDFLQKYKLAKEVTCVSTDTKETGNPIDLIEAHPDSTNRRWKGCVHTPTWGKTYFSTSLEGLHNASNLTMVVACLSRLAEEGIICTKTVEAKLSNSISSFDGVKRRLQKIAEACGISIYEDFAHHPTSVNKVIEAFKITHPDSRLLVAFEPRNATSRRNTFLERYSAALKGADRVFIGHCPQDRRIPEDERMDTKVLANKVGAHASEHPSNQDLLENVIKYSRSGDNIIFMSSGSFSGVQYELENKLKESSN